MTYDFYALCMPMWTWARACVTHYRYISLLYKHHQVKHIFDLVNMLPQAYPKNAYVYAPPHMHVNALFHTLVVPRNTHGLPAILHAQDHTRVHIM